MMCVVFLWTISNIYLGDSAIILMNSMHVKCVVIIISYKLLDLYSAIIIVLLVLLPWCYCFHNIDHTHHHNVFTLDIPKTK